MLSVIICKARLIYILAICNLTFQGMVTKTCQSMKIIRIRPLIRLVDYPKNTYQR